ncbi:MAG TPA: GNAT family N-acetyltransferase [Dehalococcoidales bacterium]|nr:MAG: hypothetical protein A2Z05_05175 [Chloroflexi bacterium RBG_16_60_22]HJX12908.1 GNAT family N-acetyltransferase [Dehalococcoidales bacterium]
MRSAVTGESLDSLDSYLADSRSELKWPSVFVLPAWLRVWWQVFGKGSEMFLRTVRQGDRVIGIAPLRVTDGTALFIGDTDVCDYSDFVVVPGREVDFFGALLDDLKENGIGKLDLEYVRPEAAVLTHLVPLAESRGGEVVRTQEDITVEMDLPPDFDAYLATLSAKQRHEVRRKMRRLAESGEIRYRFVEDNSAVPETLDGFFRMFTESREDKSAFLTERMESFFRRLAAAMAETGRLRLGLLELDTRPVAEVMCFDYGDRTYLYNSGYDPQYNFLSVGLLSKVYAIRDSIDRGKKRFDFLKGAETYKYHLGGREVPLYRCQITFK